MAILEKFAAEIFRHVSAQVKGTSMDIKVDPYKIVLDADNKMGSPAENESGLGVDLSIRKDVDAMWFYNKKKANSEKAVS
jgi:hypothetical protein